MGTKLAPSFKDFGTHIRVYADIFPRRNGLPNTGAMKAAMLALETVNPEAFDSFDPVPPDLAKAAMRDGVVLQHVEVTADSPPVPSFDDDEIPGYRCANGACAGD